jgi:hypothetical protein
MSGKVDSTFPSDIAENQKIFQVKAGALSGRRLS